MRKEALSGVAWQRIQRGSIDDNQGTSKGPRKAGRCQFYCFPSLNAAIAATT